jgi:hypothetical protein
MVDGNIEAVHSRQEELPDRVATNLRRGMDEAQYCLPVGKLCELIPLASAPTPNIIGDRERFQGCPWLET